MFRSLFRRTGTGTLDLDNVQAVFFDLDGTLIDVDMQRFVTGYLRRLTGQMSSRFDPARAREVLHQAVAAMFANRDPEKTLETILYEVLQDAMSMEESEYRDCLARFCEEDLGSLRPLVKGHPLAARLIASALARGWKTVLATNPIFPRTVIDARVAWGGLQGEAFHHVTSYETSHFCKPNPAFFDELLANLQLPAEACLMVGNDVLHDLSACRVGMRTCLLTPWCIKRPGTAFRPDWRGDHDELLALLEPNGEESSSPD